LKVSFSHVLPLIFNKIVNKITFAESNEVVIGSDLHIGPDTDVIDGVSSTITTRGEINFMKSFSLYVTLYRDKKDVVLVCFRGGIMIFFVFYGNSRKS
jgi:hypothetical protein